LPLFGLSNVPSDSDYLIYKDIIQRSAETKGWYWYYVLPKKAENDLKELPRSKNIFVDMSPDFFQESMTVPFEMGSLFSRRGGKYPIDLILTTRVGGSIIAQSQLSDFRRPDPIPVFIIEAMVRAWQRPNYVDAALRALSYCTANVWLLSDEEKTRAMDIIKPVASPTMYKKFLENVKYFGTGVRTKTLDPYLNKDKNKKFQLFFGARFSVEKRPDVMLEFFEKFYSFGRDVDIVITTQHIGSRYLLKMAGPGKASSVKELIK